MGGPDLLVAGGVVGSVVMALVLRPGSTRSLARLDEEPSVPDLRLPLTAP